MEDLRCSKIRNQSIGSAEGGGCPEGVIPISRGFSQISSGIFEICQISFCYYCYNYYYYYYYCVVDCAYKSQIKIISSHLPR